MVILFRGVDKYLLMEVTVVVAEVVVAVVDMMELPQVVAVRVQMVHREAQ